jgi:hypothetical protein
MYGALCLGLVGAAALELLYQKRKADIRRIQAKEFGGMYDSRKDAIVFPPVRALPFSPIDTLRSYMKANERTPPDPEYVKEAV